MSKFPPSWGVVSSTTLDSPLDVAKPATRVLLVSFFRPPPDVSTAIRTSSFATVDISDKLPAATELKLVPSAISKLPAVLVPIVMSSPDTVKSPLISTSPLISIVVAFISISVSETRSRTPSAD